MRTKTTKMIEKEVLICKCDFCDFETDHNRGCCGSSPVMECSFCNKDGCREHRKNYRENDWEDYPDFTACEACIPKVDFAEFVAGEIAGRYDIWREVVEKVYNNMEEYDYYREDFEEHMERQKKIAEMKKPFQTQDMYL